MEEALKTKNYTKIFHQEFQGLTRVDVHGEFGYHSEDSRLRQVKYK